MWSSCSFEHLDSIALGEKFVHEAMKYLKPGGWAVHTTEYNVSSNTTTINSGNLLLFRRCNIEPIADRLRADGTLPGDLMVDVPPYKEQIHLKLSIGSSVATSIGLIIQKAG